MTSRPKQPRLTSRQKQLRFAYERSGLTPLQRIVLDAFSDGRSQDRMTIAVHLDGGWSRITKYSRVKLMADDVLQQLNDLGLTRRDADGWHWLIDRAAAGRPSPPVDASAIASEVAT